jgi:hypothetical protein
VLQNSQHYFQVAKKFHMWEVAEEIIRFFKLPNDYKNEIDLLKYFTNLKEKISMDCYEGQNFKIESIIDFEYLKHLIIKDIQNRNPNFHTTEEISAKTLNFEYFKIVFDLSLSENISPYKSTVLMDKAIEFLVNSLESSNKDFFDLIRKYKLFIDPELSKDEEGLSKMIVSTKNLGIDTTQFKQHKEIISSHRKALENLMEKVNQVNSIQLSYKELNQYFVEADKTLQLYEEYNTKIEKDSHTLEPTQQTNYLKMFLNYLMRVGDIYYQARIKYKTNGSNYLRLLKKYPKEIIAKLFLKYNSESEALKVAKMTKTDLISVILEFTDYYKKSIINFTEFNHIFNELLTNFELTNNLNLLDKDNTRSIFETISEKEEWVRGSEKTFPLSMRILDFIYSLDKTDSSIEEYSQFVPLFVSLYRIDFDNISDEEQVNFWKLLIDKYMGVKIFNNYIRMIFTKFYFYKTFYQKNQSFKHLYMKLFNYPEELDSAGKSQNKQNTTNLKEKYEMYKKLQEKVTDSEQLSSMLPKTFSYIPTTNEYIQKLSSNTQKYLNDKLNKKTHDYSKLFKTNEDNQRSNLIPTRDELNLRFQDIQNLSYKKNISFYENLCQGLLSQKQYDLALEIADKYLNDTKTDVMQILINEIVINTNEEEKLFKLLIRMKNKKKVFEYTKKYWPDWKPETTITILRLIKDEYGINQEEISNMIKKLKVFSLIIK